MNERNNNIGNKQRQETTFSPRGLCFGLVYGCRKKQAAIWFLSSHRVVDDKAQNQDERAN
jgi:hypothetical protein